MINKKISSRLNLHQKDFFILLFIAFLGLATIWSYYKFDQTVYNILCQKPNDWDDNFWIDKLTYLGKAWLLICLILIWFLFTKRQKPVLIILLALILTMIMILPLKGITGRPRPRELLEKKQLKEQDCDHSLDCHTSFPSGDTAVIFTISTVILYIAASLPNIFLLLLISSAVAMLRVTVMAHYPSDVFSGAAVGSLAAWAAIQIDKRWLPLKPPRFDLKPNIAILAIIGILICNVLSEDIGILVVFFFSSLLVGVVLLLGHKKNSFS